MTFASRMPMDLCIDAGNSYWKLALLENGAVLEHHTLAAATVDHLAALLGERWISNAMVASVVEPPLELWEFLKAKVHGRVFELSPSLHLPFELGYETPGTLGSDRLANAAGAVERFPGCDVLAIDMGTCVTYDVVRNGVYEGGAISPGLRIRSKAMHNYTERLPFLEPADNPPDLPGTDTTASLKAGVWHGLRFEMEGFIAYFEKYGEETQAVVTGGQAQRFEGALSGSVSIDSLLTLRGLGSILRLNVE